MIKDIAKGFMFTIGAFLAINVIGIIDGSTKMTVNKKSDKAEE